MLISAGMNLPKKVFGHGFLTREGQKMGKSLGNVLDPDLLLSKYGKDAVRWYLLKDISLGSDGDFQNRRFVDIINNDLANTIGNLLNRTSSMSRKSPSLPNEISFNKYHLTASFPYLDNKRSGSKTFPKLLPIF
jgi:methionyl-tRNA synthetase